MATTARYRDGDVGVRPAAQRWQALQSVDTARLLLLGGTAILVAICVARLVGIGQSSQAAIAFGLFIAFGELLRLSLPGGREAAPIAMTAALALAMALTVAPVHHPHAHPESVLPISATQVVAVAALGMALGALPHIAAGRPGGATGMSARLAAVALVAFIFRPLASTIWMPGRWYVAFCVMAVLATMAWLLETVIIAVIRAEDLRARYSVTLADELRVQWRLGLAVGISAIITVFGATVMGLDELAVFAGPLFVIQLAFRRYAGIRATYLQTVRALAQVTEVAGYVDSGHSRRVSKIALAVGRELGMSEPDLLKLEYAALMHDIGQLSLVDPIPAGATVDVDLAKTRRIAEFGAEVISQTGVLDEVAAIVRFQWLPYRGNAVKPPLGSRIIRVVNAFDDQVAGSPDRDRIAAAIAGIRSRTDRDYDPAVVAALAIVTSRLPLSRL
ncbi:MAG TPA: HD domain-containing phosphohydrolase [Streptosporangiaceae bacterium]|nr:HD domain-containing phosphohydrolase [Streptosporangiaceae bacterium]